MLSSGGGTRQYGAGTLGARDPGVVLGLRFGVGGVSAGRWPDAAHDRRAFATRIGGQMTRETEG